MDKKALEQKLGKLMYQRLQIEARVTPLQAQYRELSKQILDVANEISAIKPKDKK